MKIHQHVIIWTTLTVLFITCPLIYADYRLFDNFQDKATAPISQQDGWYSSSSNNQVVSDPCDSSNLILMVPSDSSIIRKRLAPERVGILDNTSRIMFMRLMISRKQTFSLGLSPWSYPSEFSDFSPEIAMSNSAQNLDLKVWDDGIGNYEFITQLSPNIWYNMWVSVDALTNTYQIWLNDTPLTDASPTDKLSTINGLDTFEFRTGKSSDMKMFYIKTAGGGSSANFGPIYLDDIYFELSGDMNLNNPLTANIPLPGDANEDNIVNFNDIIILAQNFMTGPLPPATWSQGNFDYDDKINLNDLGILAQYWLEMKISI